MVASDLLSSRSFPKHRATAADAAERVDAPTVSGDDIMSELQLQLQCAVKNNRILQGNIDTLKAVAHQLAAQLDLANSQLMLRDEMAEAQALRGADGQGSDTVALTKSQEPTATTVPSAAAADYERRIAALHAALQAKDEMLLALRHEMAQREVDAAALLRAAVQEKNREILGLMDERNKWQRIIEAGQHAQVRQK
ncbi:hypothetical protein DQ04_06251020 [Trypanosoma grayi]|uniref:hypothetical protein n=1 Tax=Trypanosoma grayi TaxID=71804 RepID=UPI0004F404CE|nr:hypothetical protein DQ04_06251020 [Trypanosoma grayi]KEG08885.1 hypothetical protein DQ04_06251020 [Trypanosoma grayi]